MKIYIICPVRNQTEEQVSTIMLHATRLRVFFGHTVHVPMLDAPQEDETGYYICCVHCRAMEEADRVDVFWDESSLGSHFDLGMAFALRKKLNLVEVFNGSTEKSYLSFLKELIRRQ